MRSCSFKKAGILVAFCVASAAMAAATPRRGCLNDLEQRPVTVSAFPHAPFDGRVLRDVVRILPIAASPLMPSPL